MNKLRMKCANCGHQMRDHNKYETEGTFCLYDYEENPDKPEDFCECEKFSTDEDIKNERFRFRYVLAEGWPFPEYKEKIGLKVMMQDRDGKIVHIRFPLETHFEDKDCPKYRLILERVDDEKRI